jgi:hypothetical protein
MGGFGEASIQDVARRVMPCPLQVLPRDAELLAFEAG